MFNVKKLLKSISDERLFVLFPVLVNAWIYLPLVNEFPVWVSLFVLLLLVWCGLKTFNIVISIFSKFSRWTVLVAIAATLFEYQTLLGNEPATVFLSLLVPMKFLESKTQRDLRLYAFLMSFLLVGVALYGQSIWSTFHLLFAFILLATVFYAHSTSRPELTKIRSGLVLMSKYCLMAIPLVVSIFLFFPRFGATIIPAPSLNVKAVTGLSETIEPGTVARLSQDDSVAFRAKMTDMTADQDIRPDKLYWRVLTLSNIDGSRWTRSMYDRFRVRESETSSETNSEITEDSNLMVYEIILDPQYNKFLPALDYPLKVYSLSHSGHSAYMSNSKTFATLKDITFRLKYNAVSSMNGHFQQVLGLEEKKYYVRLPKMLKGDILQIAQKWSEDSTDDDAYIEKVLQFFSRNLSYTLNPGSYTAQEEEDFLNTLFFKSKNGFCEHFALAFATLMRFRSIPSRLVAGYQGGEYNPYGDYWLVRQKNAHVWVEIWTVKKGWLRIDPTFYVLPERILNGVESIERGNNYKNTTWFKSYLSLQQGIDDLNNRWNRFLLNFDLTYQRDMVKNFFRIGLGWHELMATLLILISMIVFLLLFISSFSRIPFGPISLETRLDKQYQILLKIMAQKGFLKFKWEDPLDFIKRIRLHDQLLAEKLILVFNFYVELKYGPLELSYEKIKKFSSCIKKLKTSINV